MRKRILFTLLLICIHCIVFAQNKIRLDWSAGVKAISPEIFAEGIISTNLNERDMAISPDGRELYFTLIGPQNIFSTILQMTRDERGNWSGPRTASFSGKYGDLEPAFTSDGKRLYFVSNRPLKGGGEKKDYDIWYVDKVNGSWGEPVNIGLPVNTPANEFYPSVGRSGNLYFTAEYEKGKGKEDIYISKWENGKYSDPQSLDSAVNSDTYEFNAFVSPDEDLILFSSYGRKDDHGHGDLYISLKDRNGNWLPAKNLAILNSNRLDYCPFVSFDKKVLFFTSEKNNLSNTYTDKAISYEELQKLYNGVMNCGGNIYMISMEAVLNSIK
ncbi:MAG: hypothetical protein C5B52_14360 [Bacteroidetes bacterium]|nr:MAG: hypothetical protein C5B52_14360 [Bacteroidota bacterium]